jgi:hypothetical protein
MGSVQVDRSLPIGIFVVAFGCLVVLVAFAGPGKSYRRQKKLADEGIRVTAEVQALDRKWTGVSGRRSRGHSRQYFYAIEYAFEAEDGEAVTGSCTLREDKWRELGSLVVGRTFQLIYHPDDPLRGHPVGLGQEREGAIGLMLVLAFGVLFVVLGMAIVIRSANKPIEPDARASRR